jgi:F-type H+-transporting ATPase subunit a
MSLAPFVFAAQEGPAVHIAPAPVLHLGGLTITNSILYGWICMAIISVVLIGVARRIAIHPKGGLMQFVEIGAEFIMKTVESGFDDAQQARKYMAYFVTLFFFLLCNNWLGLLPGVGEALTIHGVPVLRAFTADLNATLAAAAITMLYVYGQSIAAFGSPLKFLRHFFVGSPLNPLYLVIGVLEMITNLMRVFSLAIRLFLNVAVGEIIIAVFTYLGHFLAPVSAAPFTAIELFVGALQAFIFATLSTMYLATAVNHAGHERHESHPEATTPEPVTAELSRSGSAA